MAFVGAGGEVQLVWLLMGRRCNLYNFCCGEGATCMTFVGGGVQLGCRQWRKEISKGGGRMVLTKKENQRKMTGSDMDEESVQ